MDRVQRGFFPSYVHMNCRTYCVIALALLLGNLGVCLQGERGAEAKHFASTLGPELKKYYEKVVAERRTLYFTGLAWGIVASIAVAYFSKQRRVVPIGCMSTAITLGIAYLYYTFMPKHYSMLPHLETEGQRMAWQAVYIEYKHKYVIGLILGALAGGCAGLAACK